MSKTSPAVTALRVLLSIAFVLVVVFQTFSMPGQFAYMAEENPDSAHLRWPLTALSILVLACVQAVIISTWRLLTLVKQRRIFSDESFKWVDAIIVAISIAWTTLAALFVYMVLQADDPGLPLLLLLVLVGGAVLALLMVVMRALLRQATTLSTDMDAVI